MKSIQEASCSLNKIMDWFEMPASRLSQQLHFEGTFYCRTNAKRRNWPVESQLTWPNQRGILGRHWAVHSTWKFAWVPLTPSFLSVFVSWSFLCAVLSPGRVLPLPWLDRQNWDYAKINRHSTTNRVTSAACGTCVPQWIETSLELSTPSGTRQCTTSWLRFSCWPELNYLEESTQFHVPWT